MKRYWSGNAALAAFYLFIAFLALNPSVSHEYYHYYISRESDLTPREANALDAITPGQSYRHDTPQFSFSSGWSVAEADFRWSSDVDAKISFKIHDHSNFTGYIIVDLNALDNQKLSIYLNGTEILTAIDIKSQQLKVTFDKALLTPGLNTLRFALPNARQPGNGDMRLLAIALKSLQVG